MNTLADRIGHIVSRFCGGNASEFARRIRVTPQYANQLIQGERANPSEAVRMRICATFGVTDRWLMDGGDPMMCRDATHLYVDYEPPTAADPVVSLDFLHAYISLDADNGLIPQSLADEMKCNMTGAELVKWALTQVENSPYIRTPTGNQIVAQRDLPPFHDNRPDCLDARICALRYADIPHPLRNSFAKISTTDGQPLISAGGLTFLAANKPTKD